MRATVLVDNIPGEDLPGEWGLSVYIRHGGHTVLLDVGASGLFVENAAALGADLAAVEYGVLSHAHYDHGDGLDDFFAANARADFYIRAGARENCFGYHGDSFDYIGLRRGTLARHRDRIVYARGLTELYPGAWLLPHTTPGLDRIGQRAGMYLEEENGCRPDDFAHEQTLVMEAASGLAVFSSCSHGGVMNILREVGEAFPGRRIKALVGGFHLYETEEAEIRALAAMLRDAGTDRIVTGHCTGQEAYDILKEELGDGVEQLHTGLVIEIP